MNHRYPITVLLAVLPAFAACHEPAPPGDAMPKAATETIPETPMSWAEVEALPLPPPGTRIAYGDDPLQFGELRLPPGAGPFPVIALVHGGCWLSAFDYVHATRLAAKLTAQGYATWTIEYRRIGDAGGGWPQTFTDAGAGVDSLRELAKNHPLDLSRVILMGHSAGGQLVLWLPTRARLPADSPLRASAPLAVRGVIGLAAITDLNSYRVGPSGSCHSAVDELLAGTPETVPERYAQTSPLARLPLGVPQWLISGTKDPIVSPESVQAYVQAAQQRGDDVHYVPVPGAGHFEMVAPDSNAWPAILGAVEALLAEPAP